MTRRIRAAAFATLALGALLAACEHDEWAYRPRLSDAGDAMVPVDGSDVPQGDVTPPDIVRVDAAFDAPPDGVTTDAPDSTVTPDAPPLDGAATGITIRAQGFVTTGSGAQATGMLRLTEGGFETGQRVCTGSMCLVGGMLP